MSERILTARVCRHSGEVFQDILALHAKPGAIIADVTYGKGVFWRGVDKNLYDVRATDILPMLGAVDFRFLPYEDGVIDMLVLDPPWMHTPGRKASAVARTNYQNTDTKMSLQDIIDLYADGILEAHRVLRKGGVIVVKCQDQVSSGKRRLVHIDLCYILAETGFEPIDIHIQVQHRPPRVDPKWKRQWHAQTNHSYWLVYRKR